MGIALKYLRELLLKIGLELDRKTATSLLILLLLLILLPVGIVLIKSRLIFLPKAAGELIELGAGGCIKQDKDKKKVVDCSLVPLKLINPFFAVSAGSSSSPAPSGTQAASSSPLDSSSPAASVGNSRNVNVKSFNNNIQAALDSIKASGGTVYAPAGTYLINEKVRVYSNTTLFGDGIGATIIKFNDNVPVDDMMSNDSTSGQQNIVIRDLTLQGPDIPRITDCCHGLKLENLNNAYVINVEVNDVGMDGIYLGYKHKDGVAVGVSNIRVSGCRVNRSQRQQIGLIMGNTVVIDGCTIDGTNRHGQQVYVGIDLEPDDVNAPVVNSYIIGNSVSNTNIGIALNGSGGESKNAAAVRDNKVCANSVQALTIQTADTGQNNLITDSSCQIPGNLVNLPPVPAKPTADTGSFFSNLLNSGIKPVLAQDTGDDNFTGTSGDDSNDVFTASSSPGNNSAPSSNTNNNVLRYRLAETQAGLNQAPWKEFASISTKQDHAQEDKGNPLINLVSNFISKITGSVSAQDQNCQNEGPADSSLSQNPISGEVGKLGALRCYEQQEKINASSTKDINIQSGTQTTKFNSSVITQRQQTVYEQGFVIHYTWSDGHETWDFKNSAGTLEKNTGFIKRNGSIKNKKADLQLNNGYIITQFEDNTIEYNKFSVVNNENKYLPAESYSLYNANYTGDAPSNAPAIATQVFGSNSSTQTVSSETVRLNSTSNSGNSSGSGSGSSTSSNTNSGSTASNNTKTTGTTSDSTDSFVSGGSNGPSSSGNPTFSIGKEFILTNFQLKDIKPGTKQIWVQYMHPDGSTRVDNVTFQLVDKTPQILGLTCNLDITKSNLKVTISGDHFGNDIGTASIVSPNTSLEVLGWNNKEVVSLLKNPNIPVNEGQRFKIKVTRPDGFESGTAVCAVDRSLVSLGARIFCREPGKFDASNVTVTLLSNSEEPGKNPKLSKVDEKVTISADGEIQNLKTQLQVGKNYAVAIKAPGSLRRSAVFTALEGTTEIVRADGAPFILPVGDIAPVISTDGQINSLDRSELIRQWRILGQSETKQTGDFNRDNRVNSIDWACMQYDFGSSDDPLPTEVPGAASSTLQIPNSASDTLFIPVSSPKPSPSPVTMLLQKDEFLLIS